MCLFHFLNRFFVLYFLGGSFICARSYVFRDYSSAANDGTVAGRMDVYLIPRSRHWQNRVYTNLIPPMGVFQYFC